MWSRWIGAGLQILIRGFKSRHHLLFLLCKRGLCVDILHEVHAYCFYNLAVYRGFGLIFRGFCFDFANPEECVMMVSHGFGFEVVIHIHYNLNPY